MYEQYIRLPSSVHIVEQESFIISRLRELEAKEPAFANDLARLAARQRVLADVPVTSYKVGAAILTKSNQVYVGANSENWTLKTSIHAEEAAVKAAKDAGEMQRNGKDFMYALAVSHALDTAPCGICRQMMLEQFSNPIIIVADHLGDIRGITSLQLLAFYSFAPKTSDDLG